MSSTTKLVQDIADMNIFQAGTRDNKHPALHTHHHKEDIEVLHVFELVGQGGDVTNEVIDRSMGNSDGSCYNEFSIQ